MAYNRVYLEQNVFDAALERVRWVFDTFKQVVVSFSGGKDSTVMLNLALRVAEEKKRLPVTVMFIDQEGEWQGTIDYVKEVMYDPRVRPAWLQVPFRIFNATSPDDEWLHTWEPGKEDLWIHPQDPISIKRNVYGTDRFKPLFSAWCRYHYPTQPVGSLAGIRCEESPGRVLALTSRTLGKPRHGYSVTWGWSQNAARKHFVLCPLYDWGYRDIWKSIHDHNWPYNKVYDYQYQYGLPPAQMRVSNLHHEQAVRTLWYLQEMEPETWQRVQQRLKGVNMAGQMQGGFYCGNDLPRAFASWVEYRDYLVENLIPNPDHQAYFFKMFARFEKMYAGSPEWMILHMHQTQISAILKHDRFGVVMGTWTATHRPPNKVLEWEARQVTKRAAEVAELAALAELTAADPSALVEADELADASAPF